MAEAREENPPFQRVLIANRGEIAIRIARAARGLGIESVACLQRGGRASLHTRFADSMVQIGGGRRGPGSPLSRRGGARAGGEAVRL